MEHILNHVESGLTKCPPLRSSKPFGEPYALSLHKRAHTDSARKHVCSYCGNAYLSKLKLNEHEKKHVTVRLTCHHCSKSLVEKKSLVDHLKVCKKVPGFDQRSKEELHPFRCLECYRNYAHKMNI